MLSCDDQSGQGGLPGESLEDSIKQKGNGHSDKASAQATSAF